jgi:hypothetical protein
MRSRQQVGQEGRGIMGAKHNATHGAVRSSGRRAQGPQATSRPAARRRIGARSQEEFVTFKFKVPRSDYIQAKKIVSILENELHARIDLSNLGRGWLTRLITAEKEVIDAARQQEKLKTPNPRNPLEVAEIDHAMTVVQAVAFRRATVVR